MKKDYLFEIWKDVKGYEGKYQVSSFGRVKSFARNGRILKPALNKNGYLLVNLWNNNHSKSFYVHRLVAEAFIPNPLNLRFVNHKDECKTNNFVENLEWCTKDYNESYGTRNQRISEKHNVAVEQYDLEGNLIKVFESQSIAAKELGTYQGNISACCLGKQKQHKGFVFKACTVYTPRP